MIAFASSTPTPRQEPVFAPPRSCPGRPGPPPGRVQLAILEAAAVLVALGQSPTAEAIARIVARQPSAVRGSIRGLVDRGLWLHGDVEDGSQVQGPTAKVRLAAPRAGWEPSEGARRQLARECGLGAVGGSPAEASQVYRWQYRQVLRRAARERMVRS